MLDVTPAVSQYFRDVNDHLNLVNEEIVAQRDLLSTILQANMAVISVEQSDIVRKISGWAAIITVPTFIASFYGMNFEHMPELRWAGSYPLVIALMVIIGSRCTARSSAPAGSRWPGSRRTCTCCARRTRSTAATPSRSRSPSSRRTALALGGPLRAQLQARVRGDARPLPPAAPDRARGRSAARDGPSGHPGLPRVGFTSLGSFGNAFRALIGEPPSAYRDRHRGAPPPQVPACFTLMWTRPVGRAVSKKRTGRRALASPADHDQEVLPR